MNEAGEGCMNEWRRGFIKHSRALFVCAILLILLAIFLAALYVLGSHVKSSKDDSADLEDRITVVPLPTSSASAVLRFGTPVDLQEKDYDISTIDRKTKLDKSNLKVTVLNGSGVRGAAKDVAEYLEELGYKIVKVDNADGFGYTNLTLMVKESRGEYMGLLKRDLEANPVFASVSARIYDNISSDAVVVVGR
jgi:LytR cell envelope-related transcriptional attenuator